MRPLLRIWPARDNWFLTQRLPTPVRLRGDRFPRSVRRMPVLPRGIYFNYVSWMLLLIGVYVVRYLMFWYMVTGTFASTKGIPLQPLPVELDRTAIEQFQHGSALVEDGAVVIRPQDTRIDMARLTGDGTVGFDDGSSDPATFLANVCVLPDSREKVVAIVPAGDSSYARVVDVLDQLRSSLAANCEVRFAIAKPDQETATTP